MEMNLRGGREATWKLKNQPGVNRGSPVRADDARYLHPPYHQGVFSLALRGFFTLHTYSVVTGSHSLRLYTKYLSTVTCTKT